MPKKTVKTVAMLLVRTKPGLKRNCEILSKAVETS